MARSWDDTSADGRVHKHGVLNDASYSGGGSSWTFQDAGSLSSFEFRAVHSSFIPQGLLTSASAAGTSPSMEAEVTFIGGVTAAGKIGAQNDWNWNGDKHATYDTDAGDAHKWQGGHAGTSGGTVLYYFDPDSAWSSGEKAVFKAGLTLWSDEANVKFVQTTHAADADLTFERGSDGSAWEDGTWSGNTSIGSSTLGKTKSNQEISIDTDTFGFGPINAKIGTAGGYVWGTIVHEEGHMLGLGHAGAYNGDVKPGVQQYSAYDTLQWSVMSYIEPGDASAKYYDQYTVTGTKWHGNDPTTPMMLDIIAAQRLYGVSTSSTFAGGQTFGFNCNIDDAAKTFFDFTVNKKPVVTIWDSGDNNTLDLSGFTANSKIDLNAGSFSSCAGLTNNLCIAQNTAIDTAIGGVGNDTIIANIHSDLLVGGAGDDTYVFKSAADSTGALYDTVSGFNADHDWFNVSGTVKKVDAAVTVGSLSVSNFDGDLAEDIGASKLGAHHAVEFTPGSGELKGDHFLIVDLNGHAGYQAGADLVVLLSSASHIADLSAFNFI